MIEEIKSEVEDTKEEEEQLLEQDEELEFAEEIEIDETEILKEEIAALQTQSEEYLDGWQRERAEFANYKKRTDRERQQLQHNISGNIIRRYLEILDDHITVLADSAEHAAEIDIARAEEARERAERLLAEGPTDPVDRRVIEGALRRSKVRLKVARRRRRPTLPDISPRP